MLQIVGPCPGPTFFLAIDSHAQFEPVNIISLSYFKCSIIVYMARTADREHARIMRSKGKSYTEIKNKIKVSKSTLSVWLRDMPLSEERMRAVRDLNPRRIENFRATMQLKREKRLEIAYQKVAQDLGALSSRDIFLAGFFLYWGEGTKSMRGRVAISNTDPAVVTFFLRWIECLGVPQSQVKIKLHVYMDMDAKKEMTFWAEKLQIPYNCFRSPYVKKSKLSGLTYKNGFGHGTCNAIFENIALWEYITMGLKYIHNLKLGA